MTEIISAFPGTGKTYAKEQLEKLGVGVIDSDSSLFSWVTDEYGKRVRNPDFVRTYLTSIKGLMERDDIQVIFVSTHEEVRKALVKEEIEFYTVAPSLDQKEAYLERYKDRGSDDSFIELMDENFESFLTSIDRTCFRKKTYYGERKLKYSIGDGYIFDLFNIDAQKVADILNEDLVNLVLDKSGASGVDTKYLGSFGIAEMIIKKDRTGLSEWVQGELDTFPIVVDEIVDQGRWETTHRYVYDLGDDVFIQSYEVRGSTEMQEADADLDISRVYKKEVLTTVYQ